MSSVSDWQLPAWLSEWSGSEEIAHDIDVETFCSTVRALVDLVLAEDTVVLDSLPPALESSIIAPLGTLAHVYEEGRSLLEIVVAARIVRRSAVPYLEAAPKEVAELVRALPD